MITYSEYTQFIPLYGPTITSDGYDADKQAYNDWKPRVVLERENPKYGIMAINTNNYTGHDVDYNPSLAIFARVSNNSNTNTLMVEKRTGGGTFLPTGIFRSDVRVNSPIRLY